MNLSIKISHSLIKAVVITEGITESFNDNLVKFPFFKDLNSLLIHKHPYVTISQHKLSRIRAVI